MTDFFRFPHTPHLAWLGAGQPRDDKVLPPDQVSAILSGEIVVEEKLDGANLGLSVDEDGEVRAQNRGSYLDLRAPHGQFKPLRPWIDARRHSIADALYPDLILFGEWCHALHSIRYLRLPDWFLAFDVYDRRAGQFWSAARRDALVHDLGLALVPRLGAGRFDLRRLTALLGHSQLSDGPAEGLYIRRDDGDRLLARAKLVRREFVQTIDEHWSRRALQTNTLVRTAGR